MKFEGGKSAMVKKFVVVLESVRGDGWEVMGKRVKT
jgi:hypothetical protein